MIVCVDRSSSLALTLCPMGRSSQTWAPHQRRQEKGSPKLLASLVLSMWLVMSACSACSSDCTVEMRGDGWCDSSCNAKSCDWDSGDCTGYGGQRLLQCAAGTCTKEKYLDDACASDCNSWECNYDRGACPMFVLTDGATEDGTCPISSNPGGSSVAESATCEIHDVAPDSVGSLHLRAEVVFGSIPASEASLFGGSIEFALSSPSCESGECVDKNAEYEVTIGCESVEEVNNLHFYADDSSEVVTWDNPLKGDQAEVSIPIIPKHFTTESGEESSHEGFRRCLKHLTYIDIRYDVATSPPQAITYVLEDFRIFSGIDPPEPALLLPSSAQFGGRAPEFPSELAFTFVGTGFNIKNSGMYYDMTCRFRHGERTTVSTATIPTRGLDRLSESEQRYGDDGWEGLSCHGPPSWDEDGSLSMDGKIALCVKYDVNGEGEAETCSADYPVVIRQGDGLKLYLIDSHSNDYATGSITARAVMTTDDAITYGTFHNAVTSYIIRGENKGKTKWTHKAASHVVKAVTSKSDGDEVIIYYTSEEGDLEALDGHNGQTLWTYPLGMTMPTAPVSLPDGVIVGAHNYLWMIHDNRHDRHKLWTREFESTITSDLLYSEGVVYVGTDSGCVHAISVEEGLDEWTLCANGPVHSTPVIDDESGYILFASLDQSLYAITKEGAEAWKLHVGTDMVSSPAVSEGVVTVAAGNMVVGCSVDGRKLWEVTELDHDVGSAPVIEGGVVSVVSGFSILFLEARSGDLIYTYQSGSRMFATPLIVDGALYIGTESGHLETVQVPQSSCPLDGNWMPTLPGTSAARQCSFGDEMYYRPCGTDGTWDDISNQMPVVGMPTHVFKSTSASGVCVFLDEYESAIDPEGAELSFRWVEEEHFTATIDASANSSLSIQTNGDRPKLCTNLPGRYMFSVYANDGCTEVRHRMSLSVFGMIEGPKNTRVVAGSTQVVYYYGYGVDAGHDMVGFTMNGNCESITEPIIVGEFGDVPVQLTEIGNYTMCYLSGGAGTELEGVSKIAMWQHLAHVNMQVVEKDFSFTRHVETIVGVGDREVEVLAMADNVQTLSLSEDGLAALTNSTEPRPYLRRIQVSPKAVRRGESQVASDASVVLSWTKYEPICGDATAKIIMWEAESFDAPREDWFQVHSFERPCDNATITAINGATMFSSPGSFWIVEFYDLSVQQSSGEGRRLDELQTVDFNAEISWIIEPVISSWFPKEVVVSSDPAPITITLKGSFFGYGSQTLCSYRDLTSIDPQTQLLSPPTFMSEDGREMHCEFPSSEDIATYAVEITSDGDRGDGALYVTESADDIEMHFGIVSPRCLSIHPDLEGSMGSFYDGQGKMEKNEECRWTVSPASFGEGDEISLFFHFPSAHDLHGVACDQFRVSVLSLTGKAIKSWCSSSIERQSYHELKVTQPIEIVYKTGDHTPSFYGFRGTYVVNPTFDRLSPSLVRSYEETELVIVGNHFVPDRTVVTRDGTVMDACTFDKRTKIICLFETLPIGNFTFSVQTLVGADLPGIQDWSLGNNIISLDSKESHSTKVKGCVPGTYASKASEPCKKCPVGRVSALEFEDDESYVKYGGEHGDRTGVAVCQECEGGKHAPNTGMTTCIMCPAGKYRRHPEHTSPLTATNSSEAELTSSLECLDCDIGFFAPKEGTHVCTACSVAAGATVDESNQYTTVRRGAASSLSCLCEYGHFQSQDLLCLPCPSVKAVCVGRERSRVSIPKPGFYAVKPTADDNGEVWVDPNDFVACDEPESCPGGGFEECSGGYAAFGCSSCEKGYYKFGTFCKVCPEGSQTQVVGIGAAVLFAVCTLLVYMSIARSSAKQLRSMAASNFSVSLGISISFVQVTAIFSRFNVSWPEEIAYLMENLSFFNFNIDFIAPECHFEGVNFWWKLVVLVSLPLIVFAIFILIVGCIALYRYIKGHEEEEFSTLLNAAEISRSQKLKLATQNAYVMFMVFGYVFMTSASLKAFRCIDIPGTNARVLEQDTSISCDLEHDDQYPYVFWTALVAFLFYGVGIPLILTGVLFWNRKVLGREDCRLKFGYLYDKYENRWYLWEVVVMMRKLSLVTINIYLQDLPFFQAILGLSVIFLSLIAQTYARPLSRGSHDFLEWATLTNNALVLMSAVVFLAGPTVEGFSENYKDTMVTVTETVLYGGLALVVIGVVYDVGTSLNDRRRATKLKFEDEVGAAMLYAEICRKGGPHLMEFLETRLDEESLASLLYWFYKKQHEGAQLGGEDGGKGETNSLTSKDYGQRLDGLLDADVSVLARLAEAVQTSDLDGVTSTGLVKLYRRAAATVMRNTASPTPSLHSPQLEAPSSPAPSQTSQTSLRRNEPSPSPAPPGLGTLPLPENGGNEKPGEGDLPTSPRGQNPQRPIGADVVPSPAPAEGSKL